MEKKPPLDSDTPRGNWLPFMLILSIWLKVRVISYCTSPQRLYVSAYLFIFYFCWFEFLLVVHSVGRIQIGLTPEFRGV